MHRCALEIIEIRRRLEALPAISDEELAGAIKDYDRILSKYAINHQEVDHWSFKIDKWWWFEELNHQFKLPDGTLVGRVTEKQAFKNRRDLRIKIWKANYGKATLTTSLLAACVIAAAAFLPLSTLGVR